MTYKDNQEEKRDFNGSLDKFPPGAFRMPNDKEAVELWHSAMRGKEMDKDKKGRPKRIDSLPDKIKKWAEDNFKKNS